MAELSDRWGLPSLGLMAKWQINCQNRRSHQGRFRIHRYTGIEHLQKETPDLKQIRGYRNVGLIVLNRPHAGLFLLLFDPLLDGLRCERVGQRTVRGTGPLVADLVSGDGQLAPFKIVIILAPFAVEWRV